MQQVDARGRLQLVTKAHPSQPGGISAEGIKTQVAASLAALKVEKIDVLYLHQIKAGLEAMLIREGRLEIAQACFDFLPMRARLDLAGWDEQDIFAHS